MILLLAGGVGGAKMADGLAAILPPDDLVVAVNVGDDSEHFGLLVSPDVDTVTYTLAGLSDPDRGWGVADESWAFMAAIARLGGPTWFRLGDRDLALKAERTRRMRGGESLSAVTAALSRALGVRHRIVPASDHPVRTLVESDAGVLGFHHYFVERRCEPMVRGFRYEGAAAAAPAPELLAALVGPALRAIVIAPSNPWLSIAPILALPGLPAAIRAAGVPVVAVSPIVGGKAIKGPAAKIMAELGFAVSPAGVADFYGGLIDALVVDTVDRDALGARALPILATGTVMADRADRARLAAEVLDFAARLGKA